MLVQIGPVGSFVLQDLSWNYDSTKYTYGKFSRATRAFVYKMQFKLSAKRIGHIFVALRAHVATKCNFKLSAKEIGQPLRGLRAWSCTPFFNPPPT